MIKHHVTKIKQSSSASQKAVARAPLGRASMMRRRDEALTMDALSALLGLNGPAATHQRLTEKGFEMRLYDRDGSPRYYLTPAGKKYLAALPETSCYEHEGLTCAVGQEQSIAWQRPVVSLLKSGHDTENSRPFRVFEEGVL